MFFILLLSVALTVVLFLCFGFIRKLDVSPRTKTIGQIVVVAAAALTIGGQFFLRRNAIYVNDLWFRAAAWAIYTTMGFLSLLFMVALVTRLGWSLSNRLRKLAPPAQTPDLERRQSLSKMLGLSVFATSGLGTLFGIREAHGDFAVTHVPISLSHLPESLHKLRIVQISDVHIGAIIQRDFINRLVDRINELKADIFVITGDLADGDPNILAPHVKPLERVVASIGRYYITGNHEYYWGAESWIRYMQGSGYLPLLNKYVLCGKGEDKILLAGVTDKTAAQFIEEHATSPVAALQTPYFEEEALGDEVRAKLVKVLLAHRPDPAEEAAKLGFDLQLSGHTHGGQYFPFTWIVHAFHKYVAGLHVVQNLRLYINRGTGYWGPPLRIAARPEIAIIELLKQSEP